MVKVSEVRSPCTRQMYCERPASSRREKTMLPGVITNVPIAT